MTKLYRLTEHGEGVINQMDGLIEEVTIDYEAAAKVLMQIRPALPIDVTFPIKRIVDAALGVTEQEE